MSSEIAMVRLVGVTMAIDAFVFGDPILEQSTDQRAPGVLERLQPNVIAPECPTDARPPS